MEVEESPGTKDSCTVQVQQLQYVHETLMSMVHNAEVNVVKGKV